MPAPLPCSGGSTGQIEWAPTAAADGTFDQVHFGADVLRIRSPRGAYLADLRRLFPAECSAINGYARAIEYGNVSMFVYIALKLLPPLPPPLPPQARVRTAAAQDDG